MVRADVESLWEKISDLEDELSSLKEAKQQFKDDNLKHIPQYEKLKQKIEKTEKGIYQARGLLTCLMQKETRLENLVSANHQPQTSVMPAVEGNDDDVLLFDLI